MPEWDDDPYDGHGGTPAAYVQNDREEMRQLYLENLGLDGPERPTPAELAADDAEWAAFLIADRAHQDRLEDNR